MKKFIVSGQYQQLLQQNHMDVQKVLRAAQLPDNLFIRDQIQLSEAAYYRLLNAISDQAPDDQTLAGFATYAGVETFSAPILAAYSSENGLKCIERLGRYKRLIGPVVYQLTTTTDTVTVTLASLNGGRIDSKFYVLSEFIFLINLLEKATDRPVQPLRVTTTYATISDPFREKLGQPEQAATNRVTFRTADLEVPFVVANPAMRSYLAPELKRRLAELDSDASFGAQVRSVLVELLPAGESTIDAVARRLAVNKRTIQRKLKAENTNFQAQLTDVRTVLAKGYLNNSTLATDEIAYLLGYLEVNSFLRAFVTWTGESVSDYRARQR